MSLSFELTYLDYLAQQPGGLTDRMFQENILQSNRERNWFNVNWLLYNLKFSYFLSEATKFSISILMPLLVDRLLFLPFLYLVFFQLQ